MNAIARNYFGVGIIIAIIASFSFPYLAIQLHPFSTLFLFILMVIAGVNVEWKNLSIVRGEIWTILLANVVIFICIPTVVYVLSLLTLKTEQFVYGALFAALTPTAIVAPFFTKHFGGRQELAFGILVSSMVIAPLVVPFGLWLAAGDALANPAHILFRDMLLLITVPLIIAYVLRVFCPRCVRLINNNTPVLNIVFLSVLIFILFGVSLNKVGVQYGYYADFAWLIVISFVQDFLLIFLWRDFLRKMTLPVDVLPIIFAGSMKNIAIAAGILLIYDPVAAVAPALGFVAHAFLFTPYIVGKIIGHENRTN